MRVEAVLTGVANHDFTIFRDFRMKGGGARDRGGFEGGCPGCGRNLTWEREVCDAWDRIEI